MCDVICPVLLFVRSGLPEPYAILHKTLASLATRLVWHYITSFIINYLTHCETLWVCSKFTCWKQVRNKIWIAIGWTYNHFAITVMTALTMVLLAPACWTQRLLIGPDNYMNYSKRLWTLLQAHLLPMTVRNSRASKTMYIASKVSNPNEPFAIFCNILWYFVCFVLFFCLWATFTGVIC